MLVGGRGRLSVLTAACAPLHRSRSHGHLGEGVAACRARPCCASNDGEDNPCSMPGHRRLGQSRLLGSSVEYVTDPEEFGIGETARRERAVAFAVAVDDRDLPVTVEEPHDLGVAAVEQ